MTTDDSIPEFGTMRYHKGAVTWEIPLEVPADAKPGEYPISGVIGYQACETRDDGLGSCELPKAVQFTATLNVGDVPGSATPALTFTPRPTKTRPRSRRAGPRRGAATHRRSAAVAAASRCSPLAPAYDLSRIEVKETEGSLAYYIVLAFVGGIILN